MHKAALDCHHCDPQRPSTQYYFDRNIKASYDAHQNK